MLRMQIKVFTNQVPGAVAKVREMAAACQDSPIPEFVELGRELANKEAVFLAVGGMNPYVDMLQAMIKVIELMEERDGQ